MHGGFPEQLQGGHSESKYVHGKSWLVVPGKALKDFDQSAFEGTCEHTGRGLVLVQVQGADRE